MTNKLSNSSPTSIEVQMNFQGQITGAVGKGSVNVYSKQSLAESAAEIQELLQILERSYPCDIPADTQVKMNEALKDIEKQPNLKKKLIRALTSGGIELVKELIDHTGVNVLLSAYEGWKNPS